jgi:enoyl-[acyl-carrier protein] reductase II
MKKTRVCELLGIEYPILQGGMFWLATSELAASVSNAGALGIVSAYAGMERDGDPAENLRKQIAKARHLTQRAWGVNLLLDLDVTGILADVILMEDVRIVVTAAGNPRDYTDLFHEAGIKVLHVVSSVNQARMAESCGADIVIAEGAEAAAHIGFDEIPLFALLPQVVDAVSVPVVAAGGIVEERGMVAAMALGAEGVQLGTRFVAVDENMAHPNYKRAIIEAQDADTAINCRKLVPTRSLKTKLFRHVEELEASGASAEELRAYLGRGRDRDRKAQIEGDLINGAASCGASAGLIKEVLPAAVVIRRLTAGYDEIVKKAFYS